MTAISWQEVLLVGLSVGLLAGYHGYLYRKIRRAPLTTAAGITSHARRMWVREVRRDQRDVLAVQTLRNQTMASTFLASTAILISLGTFNAAVRPAVYVDVSHTLNLYGATTEGWWMLKLMVLGILFFSTFFNFTLALRYYNHSGFMINTYAQDDATVSDESVARSLNRGALHYSLGMRGFYLAVPLALWLFGPTWMLAGTIPLVAVLYVLDREP